MDQFSKAYLEKKEKRNKVIKKVLAVTAVLAIAGGAGYFGYLKYEEQKGIDAGYVSPEPTLPAIDQQTFEELPQGVIYEVSEEDQQKYLEAAKAKYEAYKHLGAQQTTDFQKPEIWQAEREDVTPRRNEKPSDMLNDDMSLRYPDMFYGFVIHDESITSSARKNATLNRDEEYNSNNTAVNKMNQILWVEDYYNNGGKIFQNYSSLERKYQGYVNGEAPSKNAPYMQIINRAIKANYFESDKEQGVVNTLFDYFAFPLSAMDGQDWYDIAFDCAAITNNTYFNEAKNIIGFDEKYNAFNEMPETNPVFYYPTRVWKLDENTIVVDIQVEGADNLSRYDMYEILAKLTQGNITKKSESFSIFNKPTVSDEEYLVMGRFFNSDLTQGIMPDLGTYPINYFGYNFYYVGNDGTYGNLYVFNDKAKEFLKDYYSILRNRLDNDETPSTREMLKKAAKQNNISYDDAMGIYVTHFLQSTRMGNNGSVNW